LAVTAQTSKPSLNLGDVQYHLALWLVSAYLFAVLDFAKRIDDLLLGMTYPELAVNFFTLAPLLWSLSLTAALGCLGLERRGGSRLVTFAVSFCFLTVNLWSIKIGLAAKLATVSPPQRSLLALVAVGVTMLLCAAIAWKHPGRLAWVEAQKARLLKVLAGATLALCLAFPFRPSEPGQVYADTPSAVLVTFDGLSATHMSVYGYDRPTTPRLLELAQESWVFENVHSNFTYTPPCLASLEGVMPMQMGGQIMTDERGIWEILRGKGYPHRAFFSYFPPQVYFHSPLPDSRMTRSGKTTALYQAHSLLFAERDLVWLSGLLSEEFVYFWPFTGNYDDDIFWRRNQRPGELSLAAAADYLQKHPRGAFVWVHLWEPHFPYWPDPDLRQEFGPSSDTPGEFINRHYTASQQTWVDSLRNRYDQTVLSADRKLGRFLDDLKARGLYDTTLLVISADHGESLGGGFVGHSGPRVMESITRIPLLIRPPGNRVGKRVKVNACSIDVAPTILDLLGLAKAEHLPGESLSPYAEDLSKQSDRYKITRSVNAFLGLPGEIAVYWRTYKAVFLSVDRKFGKLYNLQTDPQGLSDISLTHPEILAAMRAALDATKPEQSP
jgi:arylsulfatase